MEKDTPLAQNLFDSVNCKKNKIWDIAFFLSFFCIFLMLLYKCKFGFANIDEAFYLTIPYRLIQGDALLLNEWHVSQLAAVFLYPVMKIYLVVFNTTDGILLSFRYIFTVLHTLAALWLYFRYRKNRICAAFISIIFLLFTPYGIMALSYNSMGLTFMLIACTLLYTGRMEKIQTWFSAGIFFAAGCLCCPFLVFLYFLFLFCWIVNAIFRKRINFLLFKKAATIFHLRNCLSFSCGGAAVGITFFVFLFSRCTFSDILQAVPCILNDPEHPVGPFSIIRKPVYFLYSIINSNNFSRPVLFCSFLLFLVLLVDKKRKIQQMFYFYAALTLTVIYLIPFVTFQRYLNFLMFPVNILGFFCFALNPGKNCKEFFCLWIPGMLYALCLTYASNQYFYAISNAVLISTAGSIIMCMKLCFEEKSGRSKYFHRSIMIAFFVIFATAEAYVRYNSLFWENGSTMKDMVAMISCGAEKGIMTTESQKSKYEFLYNETKCVRDFKQGPVLYYTDRTWLYLDDKKEIGSFSAWISGVNDLSAERLIAYYIAFPQKCPRIVYMDNDGLKKTKIMADYFEKLGYSTKITENSMIYFAKDPAQ